ncbi:MAG: hypothetical protein ACK559_37140, partial [bacterium]
LHVEGVAAHVGQPEHLPERGLRLEVVVLRHAAAENDGGERADRVLVQPPPVVGAGLEDLGVEVEVELVVGDQPGLVHRPELHRVEEHGAIARRADEDRDAEAVGAGEEPLADAVLALLLRVHPAEQVAELGP